MRRPRRDRAVSSRPNTGRREGIRLVQAFLLLLQLLGGQPRAVRLTSPRTRYLADGGRRSRHPEAALPRHIDPDSPYYLGSYPRVLMSCLSPLPELMNAFRNGGG